MTDIFLENEVFNNSTQERKRVKELSKKILDLLAEAQVTKRIAVSIISSVKINIIVSSPRDSSIDEKLDVLINTQKGELEALKFAIEANK